MNSEMPKKLAPVVTNDQGGKQSQLPTYAECVWLAANTVFEVMKRGSDKYDTDPYDGNWLMIETEDHIKHAVTHLLEFLAGGSDEPDLSHALTRVAMALYTQKLDQEHAAAMECINGVFSD